jgi:hypothetical protein
MSELLSGEGWDGIITPEIHPLMERGDLFV